MSEEQLIDQELREVREMLAQRKAHQDDPKCSRCRLPATLIVGSAAVRINGTHWCQYCSWVGYPLTKGANT